MQWRTLAILLALLNLKVLPLAWHIRLFYGFFTHFYFDRRPIPKSSLTSLTLFQPTLYTSVAPLGELDYNLHKSNGTYFTDLDIARGHHVYCLFRVGVNRYSSPKSSVATMGSTNPPPAGRFIMALGGVTCTFKRELKPYRTYEIWTRVLSWDEKWVYIISHIVKPGLVKPTTYSDQPWRRQKNNGNRSSSSFKTKTAPYPNAYSEQARESAKSLQSSSSSSSSSSTSSTAHPAIYAVSIAKYAFKQGRLTIPPTTFLQACDLLPASPAGESSEAKSDPSITTPHEASPLSSSSVDVDKNAPSILLRKTAPSKKQSVIGSETGRDDDLWRALEARRMRHLGLARHVAGLDEGFGVFTGEEEVVFARY